MILHKETETELSFNLQLIFKDCIIRMNDTPQGDGIVTIIKEI